MIKISGNIVDVLNRKIFKGVIVVDDNGRIANITKHNCVDNHYIIPGLIDAHVHIESSMLNPIQFGIPAISHGTVAVVSDPHEIANVCGVNGIEYMLNNSKKSQLKYFFGVPSCVPATNFDINGFLINSKIVEKLFNTGNYYFLSEIMNYPGVIFDDIEVTKKINIAKKYNKVIDGHAPGLTGNQLTKYVQAGISTDHECFSLNEALEKVNLGMKILIREGSAAKNFNELSPLIDLYPDMVMFCTDDCHPDDLINGHINSIVKRSIEKRYDIFNILKAACINPVVHYNLPVGLLRKDDHADFIIVDNLNDFNILKTYINGKIVYPELYKITNTIETSTINNFNTEKISVDGVKVKSLGTKINVINLIENEIITRKSIEIPKVENGYVITKAKDDFLKVVYYNRYVSALPQIAFIRNFGLKNGAIAQSISHDNHNIISIGCDDNDIVTSINRIVDMKGGIAYAAGDYVCDMQLEIGGIMSNRDVYEVTDKYLKINNLLKANGCNQNSPLMALSFVALIVIPEIKIGDQGLFDVNDFKFIDLFVD